MENKNLIKEALELRVKTINTIHNAKTGHYGGALSIIELLTYIYNQRINITCENMNDINRAQFILSKGHGVPPLYEILKTRGIIDKKEELRQIGSCMQGHPDSKKCNGIDASTGSLGQGLSIATGIALAKKMKNNTEYVYVIVGDGELQEGITYESISFIGSQKLSNIVIIVDNNKYQLMGKTSEINNNLGMSNYFKSFNFNVLEIDGHNFEEIDNAFNNLMDNKPNVIIANTIKGKGVSFMENTHTWHGKATNQEEYVKALKELEVK